MDTIFVSLPRSDRRTYAASPRSLRLPRGGTPVGGQRARHVDAAAAGDARAGLRAQQHAGSEGSPERLPRPAGGARVLPGGLEPGLRGPVGAVQRVAGGVRAAFGATARG